MDARFRELERRALQGGDEEKAALISAALRAGWPQPQVQAAADLHHIPSRMVLGMGPPRGLAASLQAIVRDRSIDPDVFRQIAVDLLEFVANRFEIRTTTGQLIRDHDVMKWIRKPLARDTVHGYTHRDAVARLVLDLENDTDSLFVNFGLALGGFLGLGATDSVAAVRNVMWYLDAPEFQWPPDGRYDSFRPFFLNRLIPSAAV
jgi:hypothetical protein